MFKTRVAVIAAAALMFSACGSSDEEVDRTNPGSDGPALVAQLEADAIIRLVTVDHGFGTENPPFDLVQLATLIGGDASRPVDPLALELTADELSGRSRVELVSNVETIIVDHIDNQTVGIAVASMDDLRFDGERAEIEMRLWCGSLCGVFLTYEAALGPAGWQILGTTGGIVMS